MTFKIISVFALLIASIILINDVGNIRDAYHEKSIFSYLLKSGETNLSSAEAIEHFSAKPKYGLIVSLRVVLSSVTIGFILGVVAVASYIKHSK